MITPKAAVVTALSGACTAIDWLADAGVPLGPLRRLGCPTGLDLTAARLEQRWQLNGNRPGPGHSARP